MLAVKKLFVHLPVSTKLVLILWLFVAMVICLLALGYEAIESLSAARAYVGGEGLWSKAQKQAVLDLMRYASTHSEMDYKSFTTALQTPLGDKLARLELEKPNPDFNIVSAGLIQGRNSPDDVKGMARLFRRFRHTRYMAEAVDIWAEADAHIERLQQLGDQLHTEITLHKANAVRIAGLTRQIESVGDQLTPLEDRFSYALGKGARWTATLLFLVTFTATGASIGIGVFLTVLMLRHVRETGEKYKRLIETANDAILVMDAESGLILEANARSVALLGLSMSEIVGRDSVEICGEDDKDKLRQTLISTLRGIDIANKELSLVRSDGHLVNVEVNTSLTEVEGKKIIQGIFRDITERKRLEEDVRQAQKMESIGRLAGGIAHDFNNLLMVVVTHASKILKQPKPSRIREYAETIQIAADKAASLTRQLLAVGRKQMLLTEVVDLNRLIKDVSPLLSGLPAEGLDLVLTLCPWILPVKVDPGKVEQVIVNLALNARDAMPRGGLLEIKTSRQAPNSRLESYALLEITDTGHGMDVETRSHIFEPFFTTKPLGKGTGLGLSTVYGIVKQSEGLIEVDSLPGEGTTFRIYFPIVEELVKEHKPRLTANFVMDGSETVLLAEDQQEIRAILREELESRGYKILEAENGREALRIGEQYSGSIDVLVTDVIMPHLRGLELALEMRRLRPDICIVLISGYSEDALIENGLISEGKATLLQKPFEPKDLVLRIRETLSEK